MEDKTYLTQYGDKVLLKQVYFPSHLLGDGGIRTPKEKKVDAEEKLFRNIMRSREKIRGYGYCNSWDWFLTLTIDPAKYQRDDLDAYHKALAQFLRHEGQRRYGIGTPPYLIVPEKHKRGGWHEHGLMAGVPVEELRPFRLDENIPWKMKSLIRQGRVLLDWPRYRERFGFCCVEAVGSQYAASEYMRKYVEKDLGRSVTKAGAHIYYASKGLRGPARIAEGYTLCALPERDRAFDTAFARGQWFDNVEDAIVAMQGLVVGEADWLDGKYQEEVVWPADQEEEVLKTVVNLGLVDDFEQMQLREGGCFGYNDCVGGGRGDDLGFDGHRQ